MAEKLPVSTFARACTHYRHAANPEAFAQEERHAHEERFLELTTNAKNGRGCAAFSTPRAART